MAYAQQYINLFKEIKLSQGVLALCSFLKKALQNVFWRCFNFKGKVVLIMLQVPTILAQFGRWMRVFSLLKGGTVELFFDPSVIVGTNQNIKSNCLNIGKIYIGEGGYYIIICMDNIYLIFRITIFKAGCIFLFKS